MKKQQEQVAQANVDSLELMEEIIRQRAYQLFEQRGFQHGHDLDDWLQAEAEVMCKRPARADISAGRREHAAA